MFVVTESDCKLFAPYYYELFSALRKFTYNVSYLNSVAVQKLSLGIETQRYLANLSIDLVSPRGNENETVYITLRGIKSAETKILRDSS